MLKTTFVNMLSKTNIVSEQGCAVLIIHYLALRASLLFSSAVLADGLEETPTKGRSFFR
jgi:hypothetical protein